MKKYYGTEVLWNSRHKYSVCLIAVQINIMELSFKGYCLLCVKDGRLKDGCSVIIKHFHYSAKNAFISPASS